MALWWFPEKHVSMKGIIMMSEQSNVTSSDAGVWSSSSALDSGPQKTSWRLWFKPRLHLPCLCPYFLSPRSTLLLHSPKGNSSIKRIGKKDTSSAEVSPPRGPWRGTSSCCASSSSASYCCQTSPGWPGHLLEERDYIEKLYWERNAPEDSLITILCIGVVVPEEVVVS